VMALCLEEHRSPPSLTVGLATNSGHSRYVRDAMTELGSVLVKVASRGRH